MWVLAVSESVDFIFFLDIPLSLQALLLALHVTDLERLLPLTLVADFCTLVGTYW